MNVTDFDKINLDAGTDLCNIMNKNKNKSTNYTIVYDHIFKNIRGKELNIFEIGTMDSLYGWREYFKNAILFGANESVLKQDNNIHTFVFAESIKNLWDSNLRNVMFDIMIDTTANIMNFFNSWHKLKYNGIYFIENVCVQNIANINKILETNKGLKYQYQILNISRGDDNNVLIVICPNYNLNIPTSIINLDVSIGEAVDKYSILELKNARIKNAEKLQEVRTEMNVMAKVKEYIKQQQFYYNLLMYVNGEIWDLTDKVKAGIADESALCEVFKVIFDFNEKRFRIKKIFNLLFNSGIKEQKSYGELHCKIIVKDKDVLLSKIPEINYLSIQYDSISFETSCHSMIREIFNNPTIKYDAPGSAKIIDLEQFSIPDNIKNIFEFIPLRYISSGGFGDYIHQLSIINEMWHKTGKTGVLYMFGDDGKFCYGIKHAYNDTREIIMAQPYIKDYKIWANESYDINLSEWRQSPHIFDNNTWHDTFKIIYGVDWASKPWFINVPVNDKWKDKVLVNTVPYRDINSLDFNVLYEMYGKNMIFISNVKEHYEHFKATRKIEIEWYCPASFTDLCIAVKSCKLFIGALSGFLTVAHACHIPHIVGKCNSAIDNFRISDIDKIIKNARFTMHSVVIV